MAEYRLHCFAQSGNSYKVRLLLSRLGVVYRQVEVDILKGETRTPAFLAKNPDGHVPLLELEDGRRLAESNAILVYLAEGTDYLPDEPFRRAEVLRWMFFEQNNHEPNIAILRLWLVGKSQPQPCDPAFEFLYQSDFLSPEMVWERIRLSMHNHQTSLATYLGRRLPDAQRKWLDLWLEAYRNPGRGTRR